jgi:hypothetical protein
MLYIKNYKILKVHVKNLLFMLTQKKANLQENCSYIIKFFDVLVQFKGITIF